MLAKASSGTGDLVSVDTLKRVTWVHFEIQSFLY